MKIENCPCGNELPYLECCNVIHLDINKAKTAEQLMRSRYSAFVKANGDFLMQSWHSSKHTPTLQHDLVHWAMSVKWIRLEVHETIQGLENDKEGVVSFSAFYMEKFMNRALHETSKFIKENNHWVYLHAI